MKTTFSLAILIPLFLFLVGPVSAQEAEKSIWIQYAKLDGLDRTGLDRKWGRIRLLRDGKKTDLISTCARKEGRTKREIAVRNGDRIDFNNNLNPRSHFVTLDKMSLLKGIGLVHTGGFRDTFIEGILHYKDHPRAGAKVKIKIADKEYQAQTDAMGRFAVRTDNVIDSYQLVIPYLSKTKSDSTALQDSTAVTVSGNDERKVRIVVFLDDNGKVIEKFLP